VLYGLLAKEQEVMTVHSPLRCSLRSLSAGYRASLLISPPSPASLENGG
jgi:hypothetical protein